MKKCKVPHTVLDRTKQCEYNFFCLSTGKHNGPDDCKAIFPYADNILFLKSSEPFHKCSYRVQFANRQMCLCPTKFHCYSQQLEFEESTFKQCKMCKETWGNFHDLLSDPYISLIGYQVNFELLEAGLFLFNHSCKNTLAIPAGAFTRLYEGPIFQERATGTDECPGYCLDKCQVDPCLAECECAYVREVLQIIKNWPKKSVILSKS